MKKPSHQEISGKIETAKKAVTERCIRIINPVAMAADALELGYLFENEFMEIFSDLLNNTTPEHYIGPPQKSYERKIKGMELFAFKIKSNILDIMIYYKFSIKNKYCYVVSLHKDREKEVIL